MEDKVKTQDSNQGREDGSRQEQAKVERDISTIDQQEGNLNNGELGGSMEMESERENNKKAP